MRVRGRLDVWGRGPQGGPLVVRVRGRGRERGDRVSVGRGDGTSVGQVHARETHARARLPSYRVLIGTLKSAKKDKT